MAIHYFTEDVEEIKLNKKKVSSWIKTCVLQNNKKEGDLNFIFCSDEYLKEINIQYLKHDYYTDIITFGYNEQDILAGDIFISVDRIADNAMNFNVSFNDELLRVIIHGVLHLIGFNDTNQKQKKEMKNQEDEWIAAYKSA